MSKMDQEKLVIQEREENLHKLLKPLMFKKITYPQK
jgi:hypothetical protein